MNMFCNLYSSFCHRAPVKHLCEAYFARPFTPGKKKLLFLFCPRNPVAFSQVNPFLHYAPDIAEDFEICVRATPINDVKSANLRDADIVCLQTGFDLAEVEAEELFAALRQRHPNAKFVYFDWFAPLDLRLAKILDRHIDLYVKRQVFRDHSRYGAATLGGTNLMDYYARRYKMDMAEHYFEVPTSFYKKLTLGPGLFTGHYLLNRFARGQYRDQPKSIDVHARLGRKGTPWYTAMRNEALGACQTLQHHQVVTGNGVAKHQYLKELARAKICFSPFGYGEVCWRDFEAALYGSLLIKPDMSHLRTAPEFYVKDETYVSVAWDFSDLQEKMDFYLHNSAERNRMVGNARQILGDYFKNKVFLQQMAPVFQLAHAAGVPAAGAPVLPVPALATTEAMSGPWRPRR